jgi:phage anti-repressor protein
MQTQILPYLELSKENVKRKISSLLSRESVNRVVTAACSFHFNDIGSLEFQIYYRSTVGDRLKFLETADFFRTFKQKYSLQGIDGSYLDRLEREKEIILHLIERNELTKLYFNYFAEAEIIHGNRIVRKNLGSFFAKLAHTFNPDKYCALDNPIKDLFGLGKESFYIAFIIVSSAYREWAYENADIMNVIKNEFSQDNIAEPFKMEMTNLKLLDLIYWHQANVVM